MKFLSFSSLFKVATSLAAAGAGAYIYYGGLTNVKIQKANLKGQVFLYKDLEDEKGSSKAKIISHLQSDLQDLRAKGYTLTSVFFDDARPDQASHFPARGHQRLVVGAMLAPEQMAAAKEFMNKHPEYCAVETRDMKVLRSEFPYKDRISFNIANMKNIYSKIMGYGNENRIVDNVTGYFVEQYPFANSNKNSIQIMVPYGENKRQLETSTLPMAPYGGPVAHFLGS